jgi:hypothetical protein
VGDALSTLLFNSALEYAITKVQKNQEGLKPNRIQKLYAFITTGFGLPEF